MNEIKVEEGIEEIYKQACALAVSTMIARGSSGFANSTHTCSWSDVLAWLGYSVPKEVQQAGDDYC